MLIGLTTPARKTPKNAAFPSLDEELSMFAVGIDISKGKSTACAISDTKAVVFEPFDFLHTKGDLGKLVAKLRQLGENTRIVMEATGHYHEVVVDNLYEAGFFVSVVNPLLVHEYGSNSVRRVKTDRKDAIKIARYCLDNWSELRAHTPVEITRNELKIFSRQYNLALKTTHSLENNLVSVLDKTLPGAHRFFSSRKKKNGRQKWVDFAAHFWHIDNITEKTLEEFASEYKDFCLENDYQYKAAKAKQVYDKCAGQAPTLSRTATTKLLIETAALQVISMSDVLAKVRAELSRLASLLPEYSEVAALFGVGEVTAAGLMAEIGDVRRFSKRSALAAFAGVDPLPKQSGKYEKKSSPTSKRGSSALRKTLFQVICTYLRLQPKDEPIYIFLNKKRQEGKPYFVYMTASANKFLRIYYARVKEYLTKLSA